MPFGGGSRKCVGDQFAMMEATATLALIIQGFDVRLAIPASTVGMATGKQTPITTCIYCLCIILKLFMYVYLGATIHTEQGLMMHVSRRVPAPAIDE